MDADDHRRRPGQATAINRTEPAWVAPATAAHVEALAPRLRAEDRREIEAAFGRPADAILRNGFRNAKRCWTVLDGGGRPVAMFGVGRRRAPRIGTVWLLASDDFESFRGQLRREGPYWVDVLMAGHDVLGNFVAADNAVATRWLSWLGFELLALRRGIGTRGEDFREFAAFRPSTRERYMAALPAPPAGLAPGPSSPSPDAGAAPASRPVRRPDRCRPGNG